MSEHQEQVALFKWAALNEKRYPDLKWMYAIPNGGLRDEITGAKMKREGVKRGVPDICLPVGRKECFSLYIEMKVKPNKPNEFQWEWMLALQKSGNMVRVCYSWLEASEVIEEYLG